MVRLAVAVLMVVVAGCGPATTSGAVRERALRTEETSFGERPVGPSRLAPRVLLGATPAATIVPYDRLLNAQGEAVDGEAMASLLERRDLLEALYADADRGDPRGVRVVQGVEGRFAYYGRLSAEEASKPGCLMAPEFTTGCRPNPIVLEAVKGSPAAERLWAVTFKAYEARLRELATQRKLTEASLNALLAGAMWTKTMGGVAAAEEGALRGAREPPPGAQKVGAGAAEDRLGTAALLEEASGLDKEILEAKLAEAEASTLGPRLPTDVAVLEKMRPSVERPPADLSGGETLWRDYVHYFEERVAKMKSVRQGRLRRSQSIHPGPGSPTGSCAGTSSEGWTTSARGRGSSEKTRSCPRSSGRS